MPSLTHLSFGSPGSPKVPVAPGGSLLGSRRVPVALEGSLPLPSARASLEALLRAGWYPVVGESSLFPGSPKVPVAPGGSLLGSRKVPVAPEGSLPLPSARASPEALLRAAYSPVVGAPLWLPGSPKVPVAPEESLLGSRKVPGAPEGSLPLPSARASPGALPVADTPPKVAGV